MTTNAPRREVSYLFATPVLGRLHEGTEDLNARLKAIVLAREQIDAGTQKSNINGWHSETDLLTWDLPEIAELQAKLALLVGDFVAVQHGAEPGSIEVGMRLVAWANVSRRSAYNKPHVHPNASVSGVYYVDPGDSVSEQPMSGRLELLDPRNRPNMFETPAAPAVDSYGVVPVAGLGLAFPAWLYHYVHAYAGERPRISIAFNAVVDDVRPALVPGTGTR